MDFSFAMLVYVFCVKMFTYIPQKSKFAKAIYVHNIFWLK